MFKRAGDIIFLVGALVLFWGISYPLNDWFCDTMPKHQLGQLPAMIGIGVALGIRFGKLSALSISTGIALFIFVMCSLIFWMLPHSIDLAVIKPGFNRMMHVNMILVGVFVSLVLRFILFELKVVFWGMLFAMVMAVGTTLLNYNLLLCSAFTIDQQKQTGRGLLLIGIALFLCAIVTFFRGLAKAAKS